MSALDHAEELLDWLNHYGRLSVDQNAGVREALGRLIEVAIAEHGAEWANQLGHAAENHPLLSYRWKTGPGCPGGLKDACDWFTRAANLLIRVAVEEERERCAQVAEGWCDPDALGHFRPTLEFPRMTGCYTSFSEGMECTAPAGIAAAIRAISGAKQ